MIPSTFDYVRASTIEEALHLLQESNGEGKLLAGGHSLVPLMKFRLTTPEKLIDISRLEELTGIKKVGDRIYVGALTTHAEIGRDPIIQQYIPVLAETARQIGDMQVRNKGTVGGNIAHADPAADLPGTAIALEAIVHLIGPDGEEEIPIQDFILGPLVTSIPETSILQAVSFSIPPDNSKSVYVKYAHPASGYAVVGVCAIAQKDKAGKVTYLRVGITGAGDCAYRATAIEQFLLGKNAAADHINDASKLAAEDGEMGHDLFASAEYRKHLCTIYTERALVQVLQ
jgi:aerobic carbon-monoxide dehydrogenase medium subunit